MNELILCNLCGIALPQTLCRFPSPNGIEESFVSD